MNILRQSQHYPRAFWLLLAGFFINRASAALIWPFLTLVMRERLNEPLTTITMLISIQAVSGLLSTSVVGLIMDRFGRRRAMIVGLIGTAVTLILMTGADAIWQWALLIALYGALVPVYSVGSNAMVADIMPPDERVNAYALMRMVANLGIAFGPALGGIVMAMGYCLSEAFIIEEGVPWTRLLARYKMPSIKHTPEIISHLVEHRTADGPYGAKGLGEISSIHTPPAICNAIYNAVGVRIYATPVDQDALLRAIRAGQREIHTAWQDVK